MSKAYFKVKKEFCGECSLALRRFLGGMVGVAFATRFPDRCRTLITVSAGLRPDGWGTATRHLQRELVRDGFVMRYIPDEDAADGLPPGEGAFLACSFWLVESLAMIGRAAEARELFERLLSLRNELGLFSEEYDQGNERLIGNFPQAFTHLTLISAAVALDRAAAADER